MKSSTQIFQLTLGVAMLIAGFDVSAQNAACVTLKTEGQVEESYVDAQGKPAKRLVAPSKVVPGTEVIWVITATNACDKPAEKIAIENNVPEQMVYVSDSASGADAEITFSTNGKEFRKAADLIVREADGMSRPVRADEIKAVRWLLVKPLASKASASVKYRAKVR
jgi:uncharacterized repeat protein (TIGR01451 family)